MFIYYNYMCDQIEREREKGRLMLYVISPHNWGVGRSWRNCETRPTLEESEQAPASLPKFKNQFNIDGPQWGPYQILS